MNEFGKVIVETTKAPAPIGPYSQAVKANGLIFVSGQIPLDLKTGELISSDVAEQARAELKQIDAILDAAGSNLFRVVRTTIYLTNMADFPKVNAVYGEFFLSDFPARVTVQVAALPKGASVEIDAVATYATNADSAGGAARTAFGGF